MNKFVALMIAAVFALSVAGSAVAEEKKAAPAAKEAVAGKEAAPKAEKKRPVTGMVEAVDAAAGTVTVKGRKESVALKAAEGVKLDDVKVGDKVTVTFKGDVLSKIVKAKNLKDCKKCPTDNNCKDCPKGAKAAKAAKGDKACKECPKADGPAPKATKK